MIKKVWFDLDNSPHVPLFKPVFQELDERNIEYVITSREFAQTEELLNLWNIAHHLIGKHAGKSKLKKVINLYNRAKELRKFFDDEKNITAVSHGSRTQLLAAWQMKIKSILMMDYEYTESRIFNHLSTSLLIPKYIPDERLKSVGINLKKVIRYNGFKEELYLKDFVPCLAFRKTINISENQILVVIRPPSIVGNYHDKRSENLLLEAIAHFSKNDDVIVLIVNRTDKEKRMIKEKVIQKENIKFLEKSVDGLQLLFSADISISGGGTMNREAALLGTNAYSIFTGRRPYLDEYLQELGKLKFIESKDDLKKIPVHRARKTAPKFDNNLVNEITDIIINY